MVCLAIISCLPSVASIDGVVLFFCLCVVDVACLCIFRELADRLTDAVVDRVKNGNMPYSTWVSEIINKMSFFNNRKKHKVEIQLY